MKNFEPTPNISVGTKTGYVLEVIRNAVLVGDILPDTPITEREIRTLLNVSSTPVREAFNKLEAEGLLTRDPHHGAKVTALEIGDYKELYIFQSNLQSAAVRLCAKKLKKEDIVEVERLNNEMKNMTGPKLDVKGLRILNYKLHMILCGVNVFPWLTKVISGLWVLFPTQALWQKPGRPELAIRQHEGIIRAIKKRNEISAGSLMKKHLKSSMAALKAFQPERKSQRQSSNL